MALAQTHSQDLSFDNSGNFTSAAFDTTGDTWLLLVANNFSNSVGTVTSVSYNGVAITSQKFVNTATAHIGANLRGVWWMSLGANAGSHTFNVQWTGGGFLDFQCVSGNGAIDTVNVIDGTPAQDAEQVAGPTYTPTAYTVTTTGGLPIFVPMSAGTSAGLTANANCTKIITSALDVSKTIFLGPIASPTSAVMNVNPSTDFFSTISFAIKPSGGGGTVPTPYFDRMLAHGSAF